MLSLKVWCPVPRADLVGISSGRQKWRVEQRAKPSFKFDKLMKPLCLVAAGLVWQGVCSSGYRVGVFRKTHAAQAGCRKCREIKS